MPECLRNENTCNTKQKLAKVFVVALAFWTMPKGRNKSQHKNDRSLLQVFVNLQFSFSLGSLSPLINTHAK